MNQKIMISIIVPVYKVEKYLENCIKSIENQTFIEWELILVDDGSPDNCGHICDEFAKVDDRIKVIHKENGGQAQARNKGLDICRGEYITFLDSDDYLHIDCLSYLYSLAKRTEADIIQCDYTKGAQAVFPIIERKVVENTYDNHTIFFDGVAKIIVWGKLYKRNIVLENRIKEGKYYEDDFTTWKWYYNAKKIVVSNKVLYYYTENPTSTMAQHAKKPSFDFIEAYDERINFFIDTKEEDLEHCSRLQFCKSLILTYNNKQLSKDEKTSVISLFEENWRVLKKSPYIKIKYKALFEMFHIVPSFASRLAVNMH